MNDEPCGEYTGLRDGRCRNCGWQEFDHKGPGELKREVLEDMKRGDKSENPMLDLITVVEHQQKLLSSVANLTIALVREEYAKNLLSLEQMGQFPPLVKANEELLTQMAELMTDKAFMEQPAMRKLSRAKLVEDFKGKIQKTVEEYIHGVLDEG